MLSGAETDESKRFLIAQYACRIHKIIKCIKTERTNGEDKRGQRRRTEFAEEGKLAMLSDG